MSPRPDREQEHVMSQAPLNALRTFEAAARLGSFRAAAEALCVTQSAVSHQIRHLEAWFGVPLFDRSGRGIKLLPQGELLARDLALAFGGIDAACERARQRAAPETLVVAAIPSVAVCWLIPRLPRLHACHPDIQLHMIYAHHGHPIDFSNVDLAFVFSETMPEGPGLQSSFFLPGISVPVCSPAALSHPLEEGQAAERFLEMGLLHDTDTSGWQTWFLRAGHQISGNLSGSVFADFSLLRAAAIAGRGVALCSLAMIEPDLEQQRLVRLSDISVLEDYGYYLIRSDYGSDPVRQRTRAAFVDWLMAERQQVL